MIVTGEEVFVTFHGQTAEGTVLLASRNGRSLMLAIDAAYPLAGGLALGGLPVLLDDAGIYRCILDNEPVAITKRSDHVG